MEKFFKFLFLGAFALFAFASCSEKEDEVTPDNPTKEYDDSYYAALATISSSDSHFSADESGGTIHFGGKGGQVVVNVSCGTNWIAENSASDIFPSSTTSTTLTVTAGNNENADGLSSTIRLMTASQRIEFATIAVTQDGVAYLTISSNRASLLAAGGSASVTVESNFDWNYAVSGDWFSVARDNEGFTVSAGANTGETRSGIVTVSAGDGDENAVEAQLTVVQFGSNSLVLTYTIDLAETSTNLPLYGTVNCTVDWGDGSPEETITESQPSHVYAEEGEYDVIISGTVTALNSYEISTSTNPLPITAVRQWGNTGLTSMEYCFIYCANLTEFPEEVGDAFVGVTSFYEGFEGCLALPYFPENMFSNCPEVISFRNAFCRCESVKALSEKMFAGCPKVTTFRNAFYQCLGLEELPENLFANNPLVTDFTYVFENCHNLTSIPEKLFANNPEVLTFKGAFSFCDVDIPENLFANCPKVTSFEYAFYHDYTVTSLPEKLFANNPEVTNFYRTFGWCNALETVPVGIFDNNMKATDFGEAFYNDQKYSGESPYTTLSDGTKVHLYERKNYTTELNCDAPTNYTHCFLNCTSLSDYNDIPGTWRY